MLPPSEEVRFRWTPELGSAQNGEDYSSDYPCISNLHRATCGLILC